jgi:ethanolamine ammonia-lyase small subunit
VSDRAQYLLRPDLGRQLAPGDAAMLASHARRYDVAFVVTDGLSAQAVQFHARPVLADVLPTLAHAGWQVAPTVVTRMGRVAIGDAVARTLNADSVVILIGERPGLTAPDSMGAYLTWQPRPQITDADRNCISNIRPDGISYADAAFKIVSLLREMRARRISGVALKDTTDRLLTGD